MDSKPEGRAYFRAAVSIPARYAIDGRLGYAEGWINDLSGGGIKLVIDEDLPAGGVLALRFLLPESSEPIDARGRVVLSYRDHPQGRYALGVTFTAIDGGQRERIVRYVQALQLRRLQEGMH
ncbi:PilZ domain-containing protein [bacterium]|nr:MAG: PilZ domain-containing protein [bacterium]